MTNQAKAAHVASSLSMIDILSTIYCSIASIDKHKEGNGNDVVLISKGHAAAGTYAVMAHYGLFPTEWLDRYCQDGAELGGHVTYHGIPFVEFSTGSLGHALPYGVGVALGNKLNNSSSKVFVLLSDGELDEGSNWEAFLLSNHLNLSNLSVFIDRNRLQSLDSTESTVRLEPLSEKLDAFGWFVQEVNGHDYEAIVSAYNNRPNNRPCVFICNTIKGKGVSFMENSVKWHYRPPNDQELEAALLELSLK